LSYFGGHLEHHRHFVGKSPRLQEGDETSVLILSNMLHVVGVTFASLVPFGLCAWAFHSYGHDSWAAAVSIVGVVETALYHLALESVHWAAHVTLSRAPEGRVVQWLSHRHAQHHENWRTNLNTVIPFGDWVHGTLHR
jgi:hypothetical protein